MAGKALASVPGVVIGAMLLAADSPVYIGGGAMVLGMAGLFLRQFFQNQAAIVEIANERKQDNANLRNRNHFLEWQMAGLYHELGRGPDPGPYTALPPEE